MKNEITFNEMKQLKKEDIKSFSDMFDFCFAKAKKRVVKNLSLTEENIDDICESSVFKEFSYMHDNFNENHIELYIRDIAIFTARVEYIIAAKFL